MSLMQEKQVAIIGAGPGGLTLARLLQMRGVSVAVFERDSSRDSRNQGATLDLHPESGLAALRAAGLMDAFRANYRPGADALLIANEYAEVLYTDPSSQGHSAERPEIDRGPLRDLLIESLTPGTVRWDRKLERATDLGTSVELVFAGGETFVADLAVGADGVNSRLRSLVTPIRPVYSGVTIVEGNIADAVDAVPGLVTLLDGKYRAVMALGGERSLAAGLKGDGSATFYGGLQVPEEWARQSGMDGSTAAGRVAWFEATFPGWGPFWRPLFERAAGLVVRPQYVCPFDQKWEARPNVTLIGDAAHVMPPYAGEGVNMAMLDALVLAEQLLGGERATTQAAIEAYQTEMFVRTADVAQMTMSNTEAFHASDAATRVVGMFRGFAAERATADATTATT